MIGVAFNHPLDTFATLPLIEERMLRKPERAEAFRECKDLAVHSLLAVRCLPALHRHPEPTRSDGHDRLLADAGPGFARRSVHRMRCPRRPALPLCVPRDVIDASGRSGEPCLSVHVPDALAPHRTALYERGASYTWLL